MVGASRRRFGEVAGGGRGARVGTLRTGPAAGGAVGTTWGVCWGTLRAGAAAFGAGGRAMVDCFAQEFRRPPLGAQLHRRHRP
jgi:hypothetical protein